MNFTPVPRAPLDLKARLMTVLFLAIIVVVMASVETTPFRIGIGIVMLLVAGVFYVRGYALSDDELLIRQLIWTRRFPLAELKAASQDPGLLIGSIRTFGIGGVLGYTGLFSSPGLGTYTAYLSAGHLAVILRFAAKTVVISPADPAAFLNLLEAHPAVPPLEEAA